jgi:hypothetical protein
VKIVDASVLAAETAAVNLGFAGAPIGMTEKLYYESE